MEVVNKNGLTYVVCCKKQIVNVWIDGTVLEELFPAADETGRALSKSRRKLWEMIESMVVDSECEATCLDVINLEKYGADVLNRITDPIFLAPSTKKQREFAAAAKQHSTGKSILLSIPMAFKIMRRRLSTLKEKPAEIAAVAQYLTLELLKMLPTGLVLPFSITIGSPSQQPYREFLDYLMRHNKRHGWTRIFFDLSVILWVILSCFFYWKISSKILKPLDREFQNLILEGFKILMKSGCFL